MAKKHTAEQIIARLRQVEVGLGNGKPTPQACREGGISRRLNRYDGIESTRRRHGVAWGSGALRRSAIA